MSKKAWPRMIVDGHTHIHPDPKGFGRKTDASLKNLILCLKKGGIQRAVVLALYPTIPNEFVAKACQEYPDVLIGFASVDAMDAKASKLLDECVTRRHLKGLKLHPRVQKICPSDRKVVSLVKTAASLGCPVLIDCFPQYSAAFDVEKTFPERIGELAAKVPHAKIILAHAGGYKLWDAFFMARAHANIYFDFSFSPNYFKGASLYRDMGFVLKHLGAHRCIFGSDHPEVLPGEALKEAKCLLAPLNLSQQDLEYFFGKTMLSLLPKG